MSAEATIERHTPGQLRIVLREALGGIAIFIAFVIGVTIALYYLMPAAREHPGPLWIIVAAALTWGAIARGGREEYVIDRAGGTITARWRSVLGQRELVVHTGELSRVRMALGGPDDDRRLVELLGPSGEVRLRLPRRVNTLSEPDQASIAALLAEHLGIPLQTT